MVKDTLTPHDVLWAGMQDCQECGGVIAKRAAYFSQMAMRAGEQFAGVQGGVAAALGFLDDEAMRESLSESTFDFATLKTDPRGVTFFDILEASKAQAAAPARRMVYAMFEEVMKSISGSPATGLQTLIWMDEFYSWGYMDSILGNLAELAGHGCKFVFIVQTMAMLESVYGKEGLQIFLSGCMTRVFLDIRDTFTCDLISRMAGEREVVVQNRSASLAHGTSVSDTHTDNNSQSTNKSHTVGENEGVNSSLSVNEGGQKSHTYNGSFFSPITPLFLKKMWNTNAGDNWGRGLTEGMQSGTNVSDTTGSSSTSGESDAHTTGETDTETRTVTEQRQVRPLLPVDEIINRYGKLRPDGENLILVQICGIGFFELARVRYWEHPEFYRKFGHDGDHAFVQAPKPVHVLENERIQAKLQYDQSPEGRAEAAKRERERLVELAQLRAQEDFGLLARGLGWLSVAAFIVFILIGAALPALAAVPCFFAAGSWVRAIDGRRLRIKQLEFQIQTRQ